MSTLSPLIDPFSMLPQEMILEIFSFLDSKELASIALVSQAFNTISSDNKLWKSLVDSVFGKYKPQNVNWKKTYQHLKQEREEKEERAAKIKKIFSSMRSRDPCYHPYKPTSN